MLSNMLHKTILLFCLLAAVAPGVLSADNIYKYKDENGIWHFTDKAPAEEIPFETVFMQRDAEPRIRMRQEGPKHNPVYILFNDFWGPVEVELKLKQSVNIMTEPPLPARFVVPGQKERALVGLGALDTSRGFSYQLNMSSVPGRPISQAVKGIILLPPIAPGEHYMIGQGFKGSRTHLTPDSEYALDISMPVGSIAGQKIARSGNTGFSSGPHLHFAIQQNSGMKLISLPFKFKLADGTVAAPEEGQLLQGY